MNRQEPRQAPNPESPGAVSAGRRFLLVGALLAATTSLADISVTDLRDIDFGAVPPTAGRLVTRMDFCVSMDRRGNYGVIALGTGPAGAFTLSNGVQDIPFTLRFSDRPGRPGAMLTPGIPEMGLRAPRRRNRGGYCNRPSASIELAIAAAALQGASSGQYSGTLVLTVTPE